MLSRFRSLLFAFVLVFGLPDGAQAKKTHLFILSGQSNMAGLNPQISFTPTVTKALSKDRVIVVKDAQGGQPIRRWYKNWKPLKGDSPRADGRLYDRLMAKVKKAMGDEKPDTITFVWMQGERDAREKHGEVYKKSFLGLLEQLQEDLGRKDIHFVIGRLSDFKNRAYAHWDLVRKAQVEIAEESKIGAWVDTDDLNGPKDDLHYTKEGYKELGKRFAEKALEMIKKD